MAERLAALAGSVRIPDAGARIYKDECVLSFDTPVRGVALWNTRTDKPIRKNKINRNIHPA